MADQQFVNGSQVLAEESRYHYQLLQTYDIRDEYKEEFVQRIYINHRCRAGLFFSKNDIENLPVFIGPGPMSLILADVLKKLVSASRFPRAILKRLEYAGEDPHIKLIRIFAKINGSKVYANVCGITSPEEVSQYFKYICNKLDICPNLISTVKLIGPCIQCKAHNDIPSALRKTKKTKRKKTPSFSSAKSLKRKKDARQRSSGSDIQTTPSTSAPTTPEDNFP